MDKAIYVHMIVAAVWLGGLVLSPTARAQAAPAGDLAPRIAVSLRSDLASVREGEPLPLTCRVDIQGAELVGARLFVQVKGRFVWTDEAVQAAAPDSARVDPMLRELIEPITAVGPRDVMLEAQGRSGVLLGTYASGPLIPPPGRGHYRVSVRVGWHRPEDYGITFEAYDRVVVEILPAEKKLAATLEIEGGNTVRVGQQFWIRLTLDIEGLTGDPKQTTDFQIRSTLRQTTAPAGQKPASITRTGKVTVAHGSGGKLRVVKRWYGTAWTVGDREVDAEVSAPGFAPLTQTETIRVEGDPAPAAPTVVPAPAVAPLYILDTVEDDPDKLIDKQLHLGTFTNVSRSAVGMMHDVPPPWSGATFTFKVGGAPPATLKPGDTFQMSISATAVQQREQPNKEPAIYNAGCGIKVWGPLELTATPHTGFEIIDGGEGTGTCAGSFSLKGQEGRQWVASDNRTYTFTVQEGRADDPPVVACYIGGFGAFALYRYRPIKEGEAVPADTPPADPDQPPQTLEAEDEAPPLEAWLEPETVETTPRSGLYARTDIRIRGVKPNAAPVEVLYDTTDARGTLVLNPYLKVEGSGSRETGDMWKDNQGSVPSCACRSRFAVATRPCCRKDGRRSRRRPRVTCRHGSSPTSSASNPARHSARSSSTSGAGAAMLPTGWRSRYPRQTPTVGLRKASTSTLLPSRVPPATSCGEPRRGRACRGFRSAFVAMPVLARSRCCSACAKGAMGESTVPLTVLIAAGAPGAPVTAPPGSGGRAPAAAAAATVGVSAADRDQAAERLAKAVELLAAEKYAAAEVELRASILLNPVADDAWMNLGEACMQQAKWPAAVAAFRQAVVLQPEDPLYRADLAQALLKQGKRSEAVAEAKESLRLGMEKDVHPIFRELGL
jgi:hypothetical protein